MGTPACPDSGSKKKRGPRKSTTALILISLAAAMSAFHPYGFDNVVSRWGLVRSITEQGVIHIDRFSGFTSDKAFSTPHMYSDKAVLLSALCVPVEWLALEAGIAREAEPVTNSTDPGRLICERLLVGGAFLTLLLALRNLSSLESIDGRFALAAAGLGSIMLPYASILYAHVPAACCIFLAYMFQRQGRLVLSDIFGALATALEYPVLLLFVILVAYRGRRFLLSPRVLRPLAFLAGALLPQMAYNQLAFGSPFTSGYALEASDAFEGLESGLYGFGLPSPSRALFLLFSAERGLFFYMPWAIPGLAGLLLRRYGGGLRDPGGLIVLSFVLLFSCLWTRTEGWAFGPRYLIPAIPFLAIGLGRFASSGPRAAWASALLVLPGTVQALLGLFGEMHLPVHPFEKAVPLPQISISLRMLLDGHHSLWIPGALGVLLICLAAFFLEARLFRGTRFSPAALVPLVWMTAMLFLSPGNWGGKIDYYRGVLAEYREEYALAAGYYSAAATDPTAPPEVMELADDMRILAEYQAGTREP